MAAGIQEGCQRARDKRFPYAYTLYVQNAGTRFILDNQHV